MTVNATSPGGATLVYSVAASDDSDPDPTVECTPESGTRIAIGGVAVYCTATDDQGLATTDYFSVQVLGAADQLTALRSRRHRDRLGHQPRRQGRDCAGRRHRPGLRDGLPHAG